MAPDSLNTTSKDGGVGEIDVNGRRYRLPRQPTVVVCVCLLYTSDAADE